VTAGTPLTAPTAAGQGRFTQEDPIGLAGGLNLYGYAGGDPVNFADPFGLNCQDAQGQEVPCPPKAAGGLDKDKLVKWMKEHVQDSSTGHCARACKEGLKAGGLNTETPPELAKDYGPFLVKNGASVVSAENYTPQKGDIAVFSGNDKHQSGHIQVYVGEDKWISDFRQKHFSPYKDPATTPPSTVYRFP
jgi:uncharacterized protein RhaS with RHS repeats